MLGVVQGEPVPREVPPVGPEYQFIVLPDVAVACNSTVPAAQRAPGVVPVIEGTR